MAVSAVVWREDRVLIAQRGKAPLEGIWSLPGGLVEIGETLGEAIARELAEETGISAELDAVFDIREIIQRDTAGRIESHYVIAVFADNWISGDGVAGSDAKAVSWMKPDELSDLKMTEGTIEVIAKSREFLRRPR